MLAVAAIAALAGVPVMSIPPDPERIAERKLARGRGATERIAKAEAKRVRRRMRNLNALLEPDGPKWEPADWRFHREQTDA